MYDLSRFRTQIMGAATIGVILCHAVLWDDELSLLFAKVLSFGNFGVDIFLLVSGMGIFYSLNKSGSSNLQNWYTRRFVRILISYVVIMGPYWIWYCTYNKCFNRFFYYFSMMSFWKEHIGAWYLAGLIPLYLLSPIIILWHNTDVNEIKRYSAIVIVMSLIGLCNYRGGVLENVLFCIRRYPAFFAGFIIAKLIIKNDSDQSKQVIKSWEIAIVAVFYFMLTRISSKFELENSLRWIMAIGLSCVLCFIIGCKIKLINKVLLLFGNISLESYLCNYVFVFVFNTYTLHFGNITIKPKTHLCYLLVICFGIISAFVLNKFNQWLGEVIFGVKSNKTIKR